MNSKTVTLYGVNILQQIIVTQEMTEERSRRENRTITIDEIVSEKRELFEAQKKILQRDGIECNVEADDVFPPAGKKFDKENGVLIEKPLAKQYADGEITDEDYKGLATEELRLLANSIEEGGIHVELPEGPVNVTTAKGQTTEAGSEINGGRWPFQTDAKSMRTIADEFASIGAGLTSTDFWITSDNNIISPLSQNNFLAIAQAAKEHVAGVRLKLRQKKNEIQNMDSTQLSALGNIEEFWNV